MRHLLSIDVEEWFSSAYLRQYVATNKYKGQADKSCAAILLLLEKYQTKATFFILSSVAKEFPQLIQSIAAAGHEIALHGKYHTPLWDTTPAQFQKEIREAKSFLENLTQKKIIGYRAPYASLNLSTSWLIDILEAEDFKYDSSIFPMKTPLYGESHAPLFIYPISSKNILQPDHHASLLEIPFTVFKKSFLKIPCTGGIYGRMLPLPILLSLLKNVATERPLNFYFHPWETYPEPKEINAPYFNRWISYAGQARYLSKIEVLLQHFSFTSFEIFLKENSYLPI